MNQVERFFLIQKKPNVLCTFCSVFAEENECLSVTSLSHKESTLELMNRLIQ